MSQALVQDGNGGKRLSNSSRKEKGSKMRNKNDHSCCILPEWTSRRYRRNVTHVKKFHTETTQLTTPGQPEESVEAQGSSPQPEMALRRSQRERHVPEHLKDYELC